MDGDDVSDGACVTDGDRVTDGDGDGIEDVDGDGDCDGGPGFGSRSSLLQVVVKIPGTSHPIQQVLGNEKPSCASYHEHWLSGAANCTERQLEHDVCVEQSAMSPRLFSARVQISVTFVTLKKVVLSKHGASAILEHDVKHALPTTHPHPSLIHASQVVAVVSQVAGVGPGDTVGVVSTTRAISQISATSVVSGNVVLS